MALAVNAPPVLANSTRAYAKLEQAIGQRMIRHQSDALDAIFDLAMMPVGTNSAVMRIKLAAAAMLAGALLSSEAIGGTGDLEKTVKTLNEQFPTTAKRIKSVRESLITSEVPRRIDPSTTG
jgi:hypothetical protein